MWDAVHEAGERAWAAGPHATTALDEARDEAAAASMARALDRLAHDGVLDVPAAIREGGVAARHAPIVTRWIDELAARGGLATEPRGDGRTALRWRRSVPTAPAVADTWDRAEQHSSGDSLALTRFFARAAAHLPDLLADEIQAQALLFEGEDITDAIYRSNEASRYTNAAAAAAVRAAVAHRDTPAVWEVGGGTGATTDAVLDALTDLDLRYHFTDVGRWFVDQALDRWAGRAGLTAGLADVNDPALPAVQRPPSGAYDAVLAANVLHNATDPARTLAALAAAVAADGVLVMIETVREHLPLLVSMRFLMSPPDDAPRFADDRARTGRIFLTLPEWELALSRAGWRVERTAPGLDRTHPAARYDQHVIIARRTGAENGAAA